MATHRPALLASFPEQSGPFKDGLVVVENTPVPVTFGLPGHYQRGDWRYQVFGPDTSRGATLPPAAGAG